MRLCITLYLRAWTLWTERRKSDRDAALCQRCGVNDYNQKGALRVMPSQEEIRHLLEMK